MLSAYPTATMPRPACRAAPQRLGGPVPDSEPGRLLRGTAADSMRGDPSPKPAAHINPIWRRLSDHVHVPTGEQNGGTVRGTRAQGQSHSVISLRQLANPYRCS